MQGVREGGREGGREEERKGGREGSSIEFAAMGVCLHLNVYRATNLQCTHDVHVHTWILHVRSAQTWVVN